MSSLAQWVDSVACFQWGPFSLLSFPATVFHESWHLLYSLHQWAGLTYSLQKSFFLLRLLLLLCDPHSSMRSERDWKELFAERKRRKREFLQDEWRNAFLLHLFTLSVRKKDEAWAIDKGVSSHVIRNIFLSGKASCSRGRETCRKKGISLSQRFLHFKQDRMKVHPPSNILYCRIGFFDVAKVVAKHTMALDRQYQRYGEREKDLKKKDISGLERSLLRMMECSRFFIPSRIGARQRGRQFCRRKSFQKRVKLSEGRFGLD